MKYLSKIIPLILLILLSSAYPIKKIDFRKGIKNNVCKELKGDVLVYFVFVDTKETAPWTEFDIRSTLDSIAIATQWIKQQASKNNIDLVISSDYYIGNEYTTVKKNLEFGTVHNTATTPSLKKGLISLNKWADGIAARIGKEVHITTKDGIPDIKNPRNKERLVAHLRDVNRLESVCLLYLVNNYYRNDISITVNHLNTDDVEFSIISYKYPSVIAQNIISLFGAADLYKTVYRKNDRKIKLAYEFFPNDIMQDVYGRNFNSIEIGELTKFLIGWDKQLDPKYQCLLTDNFSGI